MQGRSPAAQRHPGGGRGDRRVVVEDRQQQRLQQHRLGEGRLHDHQRGVGEVDLALGVAPDVAGEPVVGQPVQRSARRPPAARAGTRARRRRSGSASTASSARPTPATTPYRRPSGSRRGKSSKTERRWAVPDGERRLQHGQLVVVGQQGGGAADEPDGCDRHGATLGPGGRRAAPRMGPCPRPAPSSSTEPDARRPHCGSTDAVGDDRVERPGQPDVLRHLRVPEVLRLRARRRPRS